MPKKIGDKVHKEPIKNQVAAYIRDAIFTKKFQQGMRIIPGKLAKDLDVGRGVIREALIQLEAEGLVENLPYKGSFVTTIDVDELNEICNVRILLECSAVQGLKGQITEEDFSNLEAICKNIQRYANLHQWEAVMHEDSLFHGYLVKKASQSVLYDAWNSTSVKMSALFISMLDRGYSMELASENHLQLVNILRKDPDSYGQELQNHYMKIITFQKTIAAREKHSNDPEPV